MLFNKMCIRKLILIRRLNKSILVRDTINLKTHSKLLIMHTLEMDNQMDRTMDNIRIKSSVGKVTMDILTKTISITITAITSI
jgi:hypothetical protein